MKKQIAVAEYTPVIRGIMPIENALALRVTTISKKIAEQMPDGIWPSDDGAFFKNFTFIGHTPALDKYIFKAEVSGEFRKVGHLDMVEWLILEKAEVAGMLWVGKANYTPVDHMALMAPAEQARLRDEAQDELHKLKARNQLFLK